MADEYEIFEFLEEDAARTAKTIRSNRRKQRLNLRKGSDPFDLDDTEFIKRYRLNKELVRNLCHELEPLMSKPIKHTDLSVKTKVLIALAFYAKGSHQRLTANSDGHFVAQQTASDAIRQVTRCLNSTSLRQKYIHFPVNEQERNKVKSQFYNKFGIPGVLGCIDCTQVAIIKPAQHKERFFCRKHYYALNVQLICDAEMNILSVDASHGGASQDFFIWNSHPLKSYMENLCNTENTWFLGDSGYAQRRTMMTPILDAVPYSPEAYYTNKHVQARNIIECTIKLLKARFRCLLRTLHYSPEVAGSIVNACIILHNICNRANISMELLSDIDMPEEIQLHPYDVSLDQSASNLAQWEGLASRNSLVQSLWTTQQSLP